VSEDQLPPAQPLPCPWEPVEESYLRHLASESDNCDLRAMASEILYLRRVRADLAGCVRVLRAALTPSRN
jgi:hypothetical protein